METKMANVGVCDCECEHGDDVAEKKEAQKKNCTVVYKVDLHCDCCTAKLVRLARSLEGVETARADPVSNKLTLFGFMDPVKVTKKLQKKSKKKMNFFTFAV